MISQLRGIQTDHQQSERLREKPVGTDQCWKNSGILKVDV